MRNRRTVNDDLGQLICELYQGGLGSDSVAKRVNRSPSTVLRVLYERKISLRKTHRQGWALESVAEEVCCRYLSGESTKQLALAYSVIPSSITYTLQRCGILLRHQRETSRVWECDHTLFTQRPLSDTAAYLCGLMATDGCVSQPQQNTFIVTIALQERDGAVLHEMKEALRYDGPLGRRLRGHEGRQNSTVLCINSRPLAEALIALGIVPRKTHTMKIAEELTTRPAFWQGAWDGDGTIGWTKGGFPQTGIVSASRPFAEQCLSFCRSALPGFNTNIYEKGDDRANRSPLYNLHFAARKSAQLLEVLYGNATIGIPRKLALAREAIAYYKAIDAAKKPFVCHFPGCQSDKHAAHGLCQRCYVRLRDQDRRRLDLLSPSPLRSLPCLTPVPAAR